MCRNRRSCTYLFWRHSCFCTLIKQRGRWTEEEHKKFLEALKLYGCGWRRIEGTVDGGIKAWNVDANRVVCDLNTTDAFPSSFYFVLDIKCSTVEPLFVSAASSGRLESLFPMFRNKGNFGIQNSLTDSIPESECQSYFLGNIFRTGSKTVD
ncbi:hypothetical protein L2E82_01490 [Cichorium intybus]|uniref:Uncharacterized protein n=1 Tax=Cichorium intybus TaxID=13427 RepID=A0ACB9GZF7_CICIN|nr:hypothetical protein L2E82_01490 [Cichorium intybus]